MERAEIAELFYNALVSLNDVQELDRFLSASVQWTLSAADPQTMGEEPSPDAITFSGKEDCRQLARYFQETLKVFAGDLTGCITLPQLDFAFGTVRLGATVHDRFSQPTVDCRLAFAN